MIDRSAFRGTASVMARWCLTTVALAAAAVGCSAGEIGGSSSGPGPTPTGGNSGNGGTTPPPPANFVAEQGGLRRLTIPELRNAVSDLFGANMTLTTQFEPDTALSGFASIGAARVQLSASFVEQLEAAAMDVSGRVMSDTAGRAALVGCMPAGTTDDACTGQFLKKFGRRVWRRPLTDAEVTRYVGVANNAQTTVADFYQGLRYAIAGLLQSPNFIYRMEIGANPAANGQLAFDDYQLATRLSFFLWNSIPDDTLLDAADAHQLTKSGGLMTQAQRLLASPRAANAMQTFFTELYRLSDLDNLPQLDTIFPQVKSNTLGASMRDETLKFLNDLAFTRKGDFRDIYSANTTFVNAEMAKLYGLPSPTTGTTSMPVTLPAASLRTGLLGQASFLAGNSQPNRSSPTKRGKFIREMMLCSPVPAAPPDVPKFPEDAPGTTRQRLTQHRTDPYCKSCHEAMDPIGLGLENFDGIGAFRTAEAGQPIDASGTLDGVDFSGPVQLGTALRNHPNSANCLAMNMYRYAVGHVETPGETPAITALEKAFSDNGFHFQSLLEGVVNSPGFVYAAKPQ
jgi:hypothetical protein